MPFEPAYPRPLKPPLLTIHMPTGIPFGLGAVFLLMSAILTKNLILVNYYVRAA